MSRPKKHISIKEFEKLCFMLCTMEEIAAYFDMTKDTLILRVEEHYEESFSTVFAKKKENGKISIRRKQHQLAEKSAAMAIFLGKNYLGQKDVQDIEHSGEGLTITYKKIDE